MRFFATILLFLTAVFSIRLGSTSDDSILIFIVFLAIIWHPCLIFIFLFRNVAKSPFNIIATSATCVLVHNDIWNCVFWIFVVKVVSVPWTFMTFSWFLSRNFTAFHGCRWRTWDLIFATAPTRSILISSLRQSEFWVLFIFFFLRWQLIIITFVTIFRCCSARLLTRALRLVTLADAALSSPRFISQADLLRTTSWEAPRSVVRHFTLLKYLTIILYIQDTGCKTTDVDFLYMVACWLLRIYFWGAAAVLIDVVLFVRFFRFN